MLLPFIIGFDWLPRNTEHCHLRWKSVRYLASLNLTNCSEDIHCEFFFFSRTLFIRSSDKRFFSGHFSSYFFFFFYSLYVYLNMPNIRDCFNKISPGTYALKIRKMYYIFPPEKNTSSIEIGKTTSSLCVLKFNIII